MSLIRPETHGQRALNTYQFIIDISGNEITMLEDTLRHERNRSDRLQQQLKDAAGQSSSAADQAAMAEYDKQLKALQEDLQATQASEAALIAERNKLQDQAEETRKIVRNYEDKLQKIGDAAGEELARERKAVAELMDEMATEKKAAVSLQSENKNLYADLDKARTEIGRLKQEAKKPDQQLSKLIMQNHDLKKIKDDLAAQLDAAKLEAEELKTALTEYKALPQAEPATDAKLHEDMHRAGDLIQKAMEEGDVEKQIRHLDRALSKLGRPQPKGAAA